MHQDLSPMNEEENLRTVNEFLKMKLMLEHGGQFGELDEDGRLAARQLADTLVGVERQPGLFDDPVPTEPISLQLAQLQLERGRRFGDVWLALKVWQALRLDELFEQLIASGQEHVP